MNKKRKGLTLIELVLVIVIIGIAIPPLLMLFSNLSWRGVRAEAISVATFLAEQCMEELISKPYNTTSYTCNSTLPAGYTRAISVNYTNLSGSNWTDTANNTTGYKHIRVSVSRSDALASGITLDTIAGNWTQ